MEDFEGNGHSCINLKHDDKSSMDKCVRRRRERREKEELPPPLPPRGALRRYHTRDGRLVIIESSRLPEILLTHRENSRLTIDLISLEDNFKTGCGDVVSDDQTVEDESVKIHRYDYGVRSNSCMVGFAIPAIRHVCI